MSIQPNINLYVKAERLEDDYLLTVTSGSMRNPHKFTKTVTVSDVIEWTDSKGYTFGLSDHGVLTEENEGGFYARGEDVHEYISTFIDIEDWREFVLTIEGVEIAPYVPKKQPALSAKFNRLKRYDAPSKRPTKSPYPIWWGYDTRGKWVKVDGKTAHVNPDHLGAYLIKDCFLEGQDENGYYLKGYGKRPKVYIDPRECIAGWGDADWWKYAMTLTKELA